MQTQAYTQNKLVLVFKGPLDSNFVLLLQTNMVIHLKQGI